MEKIKNKVTLEEDRNEMLKAMLFNYLRINYQFGGLDMKCGVMFAGIVSFITGNIWRRIGGNQE